MQRVERVEELLLHRLLSRDELDVVDHQKIHIAVPLPEFDVFAGADRFDHVVGEHFARDVHNARRRIRFADGVPDRVHQMCFAESHAAVQEQRIVSLARRFDDRKRSRVCEIVRFTDDKGFERVFRIQHQGIQRNLFGRRFNKIFPLRGQDQKHADHIRLRLLHGGTDVLEIILVDRVFYDLVRRFQNQNAVFHGDRIERVDPAVERHRRDLRANDLPRVKPDFFQIFHVYPNHSKG